MFIDRDFELEFLEERCASQQAELVVLYGRRRVGKTELLAQFCRGKRHVFFVADLRGEAALRASLSGAINSQLPVAGGANAVYSSWDDIFRALSELARKERLVVVLDEFTYLTAAFPPLASVLQRLWDSDLQHSRLMLILCGSYVGMMEEEVLGYKAPLYGRRTGQYLLKPLRFHDARGFLGAYGPEDQVRAFAILGGTPAYLAMLDTSRRLLAAVEKQLLSRGTFLFDEARFLLQQELRDPRNYFAVLEAIASGNTRQNEIKQASGLEGVSAYLGTLQELRLIERVVPVTETRPHKSRRGLYQLSDHFFRFWFRFVHPNRTLLERGESRAVLDTQVAPHLDSFVAPVFEEICQSHLGRKEVSGLLPFAPLQIGKWWKANEEIDLAALGEHDALLAECKWTTRPIGLDILRDLERKARLVESELEGRKPYLGLFARKGFSTQVKQEAARRSDLLLFDLPHIVPGG